MESGGELVPGTPNDHTIEQSLAGKNVMITGGLGFIGSNLAIRLVSLGASVVLVDSLIPGSGGNLFNIRGLEDSVRLSITDLRDRLKIADLVGGVDYIFNLAGQVSHIDSMVDPFSDLEINVESQLSILEACRARNPGVKIVHTSTRQVYGRPEYLPVDEGHPARPTDINGINKLAGELYHLLYYNVYGIRATSLRLTNTFGPRQLIKHSRQGFTGWFIRQIIQGEEVQLYGTGSQIRDFNYVDDVVEALLLAAVSDAADGQIFNLGGAEPVSLRDLVELMIQINHGGSYRCIPFPPEKKRIDIGSFYGEYSKINALIGWKPMTGLREALEKTFLFYHENLDHYVDKGE
jgi:UDP-glucose 4-epimerase